MEFNPDPTKQATEVLFSCKKNKAAHPLLTFNDQPVAKVVEHKHLGLILDGNLSFTKHINAKIVQSKKNIGVIRYLSKFLPLKVLSQMYKVYVRSHLDYCDFIYHIQGGRKPSSAVAPLVRSERYSYEVRAATEMNDLNTTNTIVTRLNYMSVETGLHDI